MMPRSFLITSLTTLLLSSYPPTIDSFILHPYRTTITPPTTTTTHDDQQQRRRYQQQRLLQTTTSLFGKIKKGSLRNIDVDEDTPTTRSRKQSRKESKPQSSSSRRRSDDTSSNVSPALAQWAATGTTPPTDDKSTTITTPSDDSSSSATTYTSFTKKSPNNKSKTNDRRQRQRQRQNDDAQIKSQLASLISTLENDILGTSDDDNNNNKSRSTDVPALLSTLSRIITLDNTQLFAPRLVTSSPSPRSYRLAWVGSDDAICHIGTGLHKVPLARLQEVFVTFVKGRMEVSEVIRILGPFPNVKNVLMGETTLLKNSSKKSEKNKEGGESFQVMEVTYESMIDGTGKEILAGVEGNVRKVMVDLLFVSEDVMICRVPKKEDEVGERVGGMFWEEDGSDVLLFLKEEDLDEQLEILRVA